jgi:hypothetical protein
MTIKWLFIPQICSHQSGDLTRLSMAVVFQLGVQQFPIHRKLKAPSIRRHQRDRLDLRFKLLEQFSCQTDSTIGVVSDCTIDQIDLD